jgi:uncharacterized protein
VACINKPIKKNIDVHQLPSGHHLDITVYKYGSENSKGKSVYIQSSVHGAELQGNLVIYELHQLLQKTEILGQITMVPLANPLATNQKVGQYTQGRYNPGTGHNWNRNYTDIIKEETKNIDFSLEDFCKDTINKNHDIKSINQNFKQTLNNALNNYKQYIIAERGPSLNKIPNLTYQILASQADIVLDLHTGPYATDYIYSPEFLKQKTKDLNFPFHIIIPNKFSGAMDEACFSPWHSLQVELQAQGLNYQTEFEAYTVELGSEELISQSRAKKQALRIAKYLVKRGVIKELTQEVILPDQQIWCLLKDYLSLYAPYGGLFEYTQAPGALVRKGDILGCYYFLNELESDKSTEIIRADQDYYLINHNVSSSVHLGSTLFQFMQNFKNFNE